MKIIGTVAVLIVLLSGLMFVVDRRGLLEEGEKAPTFTARLSTGDTISLEKFAGRKNVVLFFYPKDFTSGCTKEACEYRDSYDEVTKLGAVMIGISYDDDSTHASFIERYHLPFALISDRDKKISTAYGTARLGGLIGTQKRVTYVIDKAGIIRRVSHHEFMVKRHIEDVIETLRHLPR